MMDYGTKSCRARPPRTRGQEGPWREGFTTAVEEGVEACGGHRRQRHLVPAPLVKGAALEAIDAGVKLSS